MKNKQQRITVKPAVKIGIKWAVFAVLAIFVYGFSTSGGGSSRALLLFPLVMAAAVFEAEIPSAAFGTVCGLLLDVSLNKLTGFTALWLCLCCTGISMLFAQLLRKNIVNFMAVFTLLGLIFLYIDYYFYYKIWAFEGYQLVLTKRLIPSALKTLAWAAPVYGLVYLLERLCGDSRKLNIEEQGESIDRV